jgi:ribosome-binding protein aMBF1 (putative translation factor)
MHKLLFIGVFAVLGLFFGARDGNRDSDTNLYQSLVKTSFREVRQSLNLTKAEMARDLQVDEDVIMYMEDSGALGSDMRSRLEKMYGVYID